jgi:DNA-binding LytR/AlgR family response regulator
MSKVSLLRLFLTELNPGQIIKLLGMALEWLVELANEVSQKYGMEQRFLLRRVKVERPGDEGFIVLTDLDRKLHRIKVSDILYICKDKPYTKVVGANPEQFKGVLFRDRLDDIEVQIKGLPMLRPHVSYIINVYAVDYRDCRNLWIKGQKIGFRGRSIHKLCLGLFRTQNEGGGIANLEILYAHWEI